MHELVTVILLTHLFAFATGYALCLYNSTDKFKTHGIPQLPYRHTEGIQPQPDPEHLEEE